MKLNSIARFDFKAIEIEIKNESDRRMKYENKETNSSKTMKKKNYEEEEETNIDVKNKEIGRLRRRPSSTWNWIWSHQ